MPEYLSPGVYVEEKPSGSMPLEAVGTAVAAFVGFTERAPDDDPDDPDGVRPRFITNWGQYQRLYGGFVEGALLPMAVYGYFAEGGGKAYVVRIPHQTAGSDGPRLALPSGVKADTESLIIDALGEGDIEVVVEHISPDGGDGEVEAFNLKVKDGGKEVESYDGLSMGRGKQNVASVVNATSERIRVRIATSGSASTAERLPAAGSHPLQAAEPTALKVTSSDFEGDAPARTGIQGLVIADDVTMLVAPDLVTAVTRDGTVDLEMFKAVQLAMITHCELAGNRMAILDSPPGLSPQQVRDWRAEQAMYDSKFSALYYPWIRVANPLAGQNGNGDAPVSVVVPPSAHIAGIWARTDGTRGVWKAPANEVVRSAIDVAVKVTKGEQDLLNPIGVNCIRPFGTRGIRVWGARTLSASDPSWKYINVRRLFNMIEETILQGTQWAVFEPNDPFLWARVKRTINAFLRGLWRQGALAGRSPEQAFFVKCDEENNPQESIDEGKLIVEVGIAPVKPAEFVIFQISQWAGGSATSE